MKQLLLFSQVFLNHVLLQERKKTQRRDRNFMHKTVASSHDMEGHAQKNALSDTELANQEVEQVYTVSHPCLDQQQITKEELEIKGELSEVSSQIVL